MAENPSDFVRDLIFYMGSGDKKLANILEYYGVRVIGIKHHSEGHDIKWGSIRETINEQ